MSRIVFCNVPYSPADVPLGSLVLNLRHPNQRNVSNPSLTLVDGVDYSSREQQDFNGLLEAGKNTSFWAQITTLLSFTREKSKTESLHLEARKGRLYELKSPEALFKKLCRDGIVQTVLTEQAQERCETFFVVGWRTFIDSSVETLGNEKVNIAVKAKVPVGKVIQAHTGVDPGDAVDVAGGMEKGTQTSGQESYGMEGEFVYAIQYRKVKANKAELGASKIDRDGFWRVFTDDRGVTRPATIDEASTGTDDPSGSGVGAGDKATHQEPVGANFEYYEAVFDDGSAGVGKEKGAGSEGSELVTKSGEKYIFLGPEQEENQDADPDDEDLDEDNI